MANAPNAGAIIKLILQSVHLRPSELNVVHERARPSARAERSAAAVLIVLLYGRCYRRPNDSFIAWTL